MIVTKRKDGALVIALWNLVDPGKTGGAKKVRLVFENFRNNAAAAVSRVDDEHGNTLAAYRALGSPRVSHRGSGGKNECRHQASAAEPGSS